MRWKLNLIGRDRDLQTVADLLRESDLLRGSSEWRMMREENEWFLASDQLDETDDYSVVRSRSEEGLQVMNGIAVVLVDGFEPVESGSRLDEVDSAGRITRQVHGVEGVVEHGSTGALAAFVGGERVPQAEAAHRLIRVAQQDSDVAEVLDLFLRLASSDRTQSRGWLELRKIPEIITKAVGGKKALIDAGWTSRRRLKAFGVSAHHPEVSGKDALHARLRGGTPDKTKSMTIEEAWDWLRDIARRWMESLSGS